MWQNVLAGLSAVILAALAPVTATASTSTQSSTIPVYFATANNIHAPINEVVANWNLNTKGVRFVRVDSCLGVYPCATIRESRVNSITDFGGVFWFNGSHQIHLYYWPGSDYAGRRMALCHELGHYLGLDHNNHGCMRKYIYPNPKPYAGEYNRQRIMAPV